MSFEDKRRFPRFEFREAVQYRFPDQTSLTGTVGYDLCQEGVRFRTEEYLPLQSEIELNLHLKPEREAALAARVVWVQRVPHSEMYHVGCEFLTKRENTFPKYVVKNFLEWLAA